MGPRQANMRKVKNSLPPKCTKKSNGRCEGVQKGVFFGHFWSFFLNLINSAPTYKYIKKSNRMTPSESMELGAWWGSEVGDNWVRVGSLFGVLINNCVKMLLLR